jgi:HK97 family phage prohead protease
MKQEKDKIVRRFLCTPTKLQVREAGEGEAPSRTITGYAILFNTPSAPLWSDSDSEAREMIAPEAVTREFLDGQDIKMTMFHDRQLILARSNKGEGTLSYDVDERGVSFAFDAPKTTDGDKALELVRRGDISGCSFAFSTPYFDTDFVERQSQIKNGFNEITYRVKAVTGIYDFTLAADPAYPDTTAETRELVDGLREPKAEKGEKPEAPKDNSVAREQISEMRRAAEKNIL